MAKQVTGWRSRIVGQGDEAPDQLMANPRNWRIHPKAQQDALAGALDQVGWVQRVIVNRQTGHLVDGHLRVELALSRSELTVPVEYVDLTPEEEGLVLASLDPIAAMAGQDDEKLRQLLTEVEFDSKALEEALEALAPEPRSGLTDPDDVPAVDEADVYVKTGDLWLLGEHRLICGDSTNESDMAVLIGGRAIGSVVTDPPYGISASRMTLGTGKKKFHRGTWDDERPNVAFLLGLAPQVIIWGGNYFTDHLPPTNDWLCWHKKNDGLSFSEFELAWTNLGKNCRILPHHWGGENKEHPTQKPVAVMEWCLSMTEGTVLDPYCGSGTTIIAAEKLGRACYAVELDPRYVQVAIDRWEKFTGRKAERVDG